VRIDDVRDLQALVIGALDESIGRVRGVDQHAQPGVTVAEQVTEVPVAAAADLFEDELHVTPFLRDTAAGSADGTQVPQGAARRRFASKGNFAVLP
jgi:hypothetical protein